MAGTKTATPILGNTPQRNIRIPDDRWEAAGAAAAAWGTDRSAIINDALDEFVRTHPTTRDGRPVTS